mgnify:CR=1 FL=1
MIRRAGVVSWLLCLAAAAGVLLGACQRGAGPRAPRGDTEGEALARDLAYAAGALELADLACPLLPPAPLERCEAITGALSDLVELGRSALEDRAKCLAAQDQECLAAGAKLAGQLRATALELVEVARAR